MTTAVLTPQDRAPAEHTGAQFWRKRLLPVGSITYEGRKIDFTPEYLAGLAGTFHHRAYDQVPFQLAGQDNKHTNDVRAFGGEIAAMTAEPDGLWLTLSTTDEGSKILHDNPRLGVSARIVEDYQRSDGQFYPAAIQHVLGTLDPRVPSLGPWQAVDLANDGVPVIDLSEITFDAPDSGGETMPDLNAEQQARLARFLAVPEDQMNALLASLGSDGGTPGSGAAPPARPAAGTELSDAELAELMAAAEELDGDGGGDALTDAELEELMAEQGAPAGEGAALSGSAQLAIELANARAEENERQLREITGQLDGQRYEAERHRFMTDYFIAPYIVDLARPLLEGTGHTIDLANGTEVDAGAIIRQVFTEFGKITRMLDLGNEIGSAIAPDEGDQADASRAATLATAARFRAQTGI
jgi:hypothetical protein